MALDTRSKRLSVIMLGLPFRPHLPIPDGTLDQGDRQHLLSWGSAQLFLPPPAPSEAVVTGQVWLLGHRVLGLR